MIFAKKTLMTISLAILFVGACVTISSPQKGPIPPDVKIISPDPSLPNEVKALTGKWRGEWGSGSRWETALYVEELEKDSARVVHAWGDFRCVNRSGCHCSPGWAEKKANIQLSSGKATLVFNVDNGRFTFTLNDSKPDEMEGMFRNSSQRLITTMKRIQ